MKIFETLADLAACVGQEIAVSDWVTITQEMINEFAKATGDHQWIHTNPERAARESPYRTTIAHGYFTLSLYPLMRGLVDESRPLFPSVRSIINYGINKLRFPNAVPVGSRIRIRSKLAGIENIKNSLQLTEEFSVEIEGQVRPGCVAECVMRLYF